MQYDLFVCHASEDKDEFVRPLCDELIKLRHQVWYDEFSLRLGDSLRRSIDKGLISSRYGLVVLSKSFFEKNWSNYELDSFVARENDTGEKVILPVWHGVSKKEVLQYSAALADRIAADSSRGMAHVIEKIVDVLNMTSTKLSHDISNTQIEADIKLFEFSGGEDDLQKARLNICREIKVVLSVAPTNGSKDLIHQIFVSHHNATSLIRVSADSVSKHISEISALSEVLIGYLSHWPVNEFSAGCRSAIGIGTNNLGSMIRAMVRNGAR